MIAIRLIKPLGDSPVRLGFARWKLAGPCRYQDSRNSSLVSSPSQDCLASVTPATPIRMTAMRILFMTVSFPWLLARHSAVHRTRPSEVRVTSPPRDIRTRECPVPRNLCAKHWQTPSLAETGSAHERVVAQFTDPAVAGGASSFFQPWRAPVDFEVAPFVGFRFGGNFEDSTTGQRRGRQGVRRLRAMRSMSSIRPIAWSRCTTVTSHPNSRTRAPAWTWILSTSRSVGRRVHAGHLHPYLVGTIGAARFSPSGDLDSETRFAATLGGGVKWFVTKTSSRSSLKDAGSSASLIPTRIYSA